MTEAQANARKRLVDGLAATLLNIDEDNLRRAARRLADFLKKKEGPFQIVVCGGAGANKTTFSMALGAELRTPAYDLDNFVPGGWTKDRREYERRLEASWERLWDDLATDGWIVEHVEACNPQLLEMIRPTYAVILRPGSKHLKMVAEARDAMGDDSKGLRYARAIDSAQRADQQFKTAKGKMVYKDEGVEVKQLD